MSTRSRGCRQLLSANLNRQLPYITRDQFYSYLRSFLADNLKDNPTAIGLVNTVLAQGCRLVLSRKTKNSDLAAVEARKYYNVAISARSRLVGVQPSILTIQVSSSL